MSEYVTGQNYGWNGGECPVHPETQLKIWTRNGLFCSELTTLAKSCFWDHVQHPRDIVCFQVVTPYAEPKVIWVNEYTSGNSVSYRTEEEAKRFGREYHTRVAVKYVEVKE